MDWKVALGALQLESDVLLTRKGLGEIRAQCSHLLRQPGLGKAESMAVAELLGAVAVADTACSRWQSDREVRRMLDDASEVERCVLEKG
jgi:hypothetical protein